MKYIKMILRSDNVIVRTIINVSLNGTHSIMCCNMTHLILEWKNVMLWDVWMKSVRMNVSMSEYRGHNQLSAPWSDLPPHSAL